MDHLLSEPFLTASLALNPTWSGNMRCSARMSWLRPAIGLVVWLGITAGLLQRSPSVFGDQADRDLWPLRVSDDGRSFIHADGSPCFPVIDTVWMLSYLAPEEGAQYVAALIAADRRWALVYIPHARTEGAEIQMDLFAGPIRSRWFDPTSGQLTEPGPQLPNTGTRVFAIPGENHAGQRDWVLVLAEVK
jgi:hypothetical protein